MLNTCLELFCFLVLLSTIFYLKDLVLLTFKKYDAIDSFESCESHEGIPYTYLPYYKDCLSCYLFKKIIVRLTQLLKKDNNASQFFMHRISLYNNRELTCENYIIKY